MVKQTRPNDNELIARMAEEGGTSFQGASGHNIARQVATRDELKNLAGEETSPTNVDARDKQADGDMPTHFQTRLK
jgi:hypothetical protein